MVKRNAVMRALQGLSPGAHVVWLDQVLPMYRKDAFAVDAVIGMVKSTNHRFRVVTIFRRLDNGAVNAVSSQKAYKRISKRLVEPALEST
jgi:hypothetical protein